MQEIINKVYEEVKRRCEAETNFYGMGAWDHHIELVYKLAVANSKKYGANKDIVALAALLHDIASVTNKDYTEEHHIIGAEIAERLLTEYGLEKDKIQLIKTLFPLPVVPATNKCGVSHKLIVYTSLFKSLPKGT